jgi:hypothetical protein
LPVQYTEPNDTEYNLIEDKLFNSTGSILIDAAIFKREGNASSRPYIQTPYENLTNASNTSFTSDAE